MTLQTKQFVIAVLAAAFLASLLFVQSMEVSRRRAESNPDLRHVSIPANSTRCVECHDKSTPGIIDHWKGSTHAAKGVGCVECHK
ncbi:MAG: hypothetical protein RIS70_3869, partial [Planctomycetota bacterium]